MASPGDPSSSSTSMQQTDMQELSRPAADPQQSSLEPPSTSGQAHQGADAGADKKKPKKWDPIEIPNPMRIAQEDFMNNCLIKGGLAGVMGGLAGGAFGLFSASIEFSGGPTELVPQETRDKPTRVVLREMAKSMKDKSVSYAKGFAYFGALYSFNECVIEKYRAKHDKYNPMLAGCATGGMMAYGAGPKAMCFGCVSIGAFSAAIEHFFEMH